MRKLFTFILLIVVLEMNAQVVYEDINNIGIYEFLDELANLKVIEINSVVKPYSRKFIGEKLAEVREYVSDFKSQVSGSKKPYELNKRQVKELEFYWQDYQVDLRCKSTIKNRSEAELGEANYELGIKNEEDHQQLSTDNRQPTTDN